jgi:UDP-galactopyranose mutase
MVRFARERRVFFVEEPVEGGAAEPFLELRRDAAWGVTVVRPRLPEGLDAQGRDAAMAALVEGLAAAAGLRAPILWFYTPMMTPAARGLEPGLVVYDCMDELANFRFAPPELRAREADLMARADVVFTGGHSLYEAKRMAHDNIHPFPSGVDRAHFAKARLGAAAPEDQASIPGPIFGYYGVIDERLDLELIATAAVARPDWSFVLLGPVVKIDPAVLPRAANIHYLGQKDYRDLPAYLAGWDVALMPFAINDATRFISPTKTPEYLAAGKPVVSTPIVDVVRHYGEAAGVRIAGAEGFVAACEAQLALAGGPSEWLGEVDALLARASWDATQRRMAALLDETEAAAAPVSQRRTSFPAPRRIGRRLAYDFLVVGAGFAGSVLAERLAAGSGKRVLVVDRRPHVAGNACDAPDEAGVLVHRYGPHIFHTNSADIFGYLSRFTDWRPYEHRVLAQVADKLLPMPINRTTLNGLYGLELTDDEAARRFLQGRAEPVDPIQTSRDVVVSQVGRHLYETFFQGYTRKQWGLDPSELDKAVTARVPTRTSTDDRYFLDSHQAMPRHGYTRMFENMLDHELIRVELGVDWLDLRRERIAPQTIFTGPIDLFFDHRFGALPYRSLEFRHETLDRRRFQPVAVVNYPDEATPWTRITEYKHLTGQVHPKTSISYEFARAEGDPYYPIPRPENAALYKRYEALARQRPDVTFVGRLGTYRYYNMDQVVGQALATYRRMAARGVAADAAGQDAVG